MVPLTALAASPTPPRPALRGPPSTPSPTARATRTPARRRRAAARPLAGAAPSSPESLLQRRSCRLSRRRPWAWSVATGGVGKSATARGGGAASGVASGEERRCRRDSGTQPAGLPCQNSEHTVRYPPSKPKPPPPPPPPPPHQHRGSGARWGKTPRPREPAILAIAPHDARAVQAARGELRQSLQRGHRGGCRHLCSLRGAPSVSKAGWLVSG